MQELVWHRIWLKNSVKGSVIWKIGSIVEKITYKNADHIIVISESFKQNLLNKGVPEEKITVVSNWIDIDEIYPVKKEKRNLLDIEKISYMYYNGAVTKNAHNV